LASEGSKDYSEAFDLIHRTEAEAPTPSDRWNHTQLDILLDNRGTLRKPWLTIILTTKAVRLPATLFSLDSMICIQPANHEV